MRILTCLTVLFLFLGCRAQYSSDPNLFGGGTNKVNAVKLARLGPGDVVKIRIYREPDLSSVYRIDHRGMISLPLVGQLKIGDLTPSAAEAYIRASYKKGYLRNPQVVLFVKEYHSKKIFIFGEVQKPGTFRYESNMSIIQAVTLAGGFSRTAWKNRTNVTRVINGQEKKLIVPVEAIGQGRKANFYLKPGDIIFVPESPI